MTTRALSGILAAAVVLGIGQLVSVPIGPASSPSPAASSATSTKRSTPNSTAASGSIRSRNHVQSDAVETLTKWQDAIEARG